MNLAQVGRRLTESSMTFTRLADGSGVLLDIEGRNVFSFNPTAMDALEQLVQGEHSLERLTEAIVERYDVSAASARADLDGFFQRLIELLEA